MSPWFAMGLAPALQPWGLIGAGAATVVGAKLSSWESYLALFLFCVLASSSYLAMQIYAGFRPDQSQAFLARFRTWMDTRTDQVIHCGSPILGLWLIANSIYRSSAETARPPGRSPATRRRPPPGSLRPPAPPGRTSRRRSPACTGFPGISPGPHLSNAVRYQCTRCRGWLHSSRGLTKIPDPKTGRQPSRSPSSRARVTAWLREETPSLR